MISIDEFLQRLERVTKSAKGWKARCPAHKDRNPSLSVSEGDDGRILLKCFAGCSADAVVRVLGLSMRDLMPEGKGASRPAKQKPKRTYASGAEAEAAAVRSCGKGAMIAASWDYFDKHGAFVLRVLRVKIPDDKTFRPIHQLGSGRWALGDPEGQLPLYRLNDIRPDGVVLVAEGEKCADELVRLSYCATTASHGAGSAWKTDWSPLAGREVVILPDNDEPGRGHAENVAKLLSALTPPASVRVVELPDVGESEDIVDFVRLRVLQEKSDEAIRTEIEALIASAEPWGPGATGGSSNAVPDFEPFPLHCLPVRLQRIIRSASKGIGCDPSAIALPIFSVTGAAIGNTARIQIKEGWLEPGMLWTFLVAPSGQHKTPVFRFVVAPVENLEREARKAYVEAKAQFDTEMQVYERDLKDWKNKGEKSEPPTAPVAPIADRYVCQNVTLEALLPVLEKQRRSILLTAEELGTWLASFNQYRSGKGSDESYWLSMYGGTSITVDRRMDKGSMYIESPFVCVTGGVQPKILRTLLSEKSFDSGLAARLLFVMPRPQRRRFTLDGVPSETPRDYASIILSMYEENLVTGEYDELLPVVYRLSPEAIVRFGAHCDALGEEQLFLEENLSAAWSKIEGATARIALILHVLEAACEQRRPGPLVGEGTMRRAIAIGEWCGREVKRVYAVLREDESATKLRQAVERIHALGGSVRVRDWQRCRSRCTAHEAREELDQLVKAGLAHWERDVTKPTGGHQTERLVLLDQGRSDACPNGSVQDGQVSVSEVSAGFREKPDDDSIDVEGEEVLDGEQQAAAPPHESYRPDGNDTIPGDASTRISEPSDTSDTDTWPPQSPPEGEVSDGGGGHEPSGDDDTEVFW